MSFDTRAGTRGGRRPAAAHEQPVLLQAEQARDRPARRLAERRCCVCSKEDEIAARSLGEFLR